MDLFDAINARHSFRGHYTDDAVPRADLEKIVQAGIQAPSGCNGQTTSFIIVDDPEILKKTAEIITPYSVVEEAKALIICVVNHTPVLRDLGFAVEDCAAAVENMLLAITALGYATVWLDGALRKEDRPKKLAEILCIPDDLEVRVVLPIGRPTEECSQKEKLPFSERASFNTMGK
jgi:nitroreductase